MGGRGGGGGGGGPRVKKGKPVLKTLKVKLEDIYNGKTAKMQITRDRICDTCAGKGSAKDGGVKTCDACNGRGMRTRMMQLGPGMYSQQTGPCDVCRGEGEMIKDKDRCKACKGNKVVKNKKFIEVEVAKGAPNGEQYVFGGESDEFPGIQPGDIVIQIEVDKHPIFERKGADLFMEKKISLCEALTGSQFAIKHLDGSEIVVQSAPGSIIKPGEIKVIEDKGMPFHKQSYKNGNLFVMFEIVFPKTLGDAEQEMLRKVLGFQVKDKPTLSGKPVALKDFDDSYRNKHHGGGDRGRLNTQRPEP